MPTLEDILGFVFNPPPGDPSLTGGNDQIGPAVATAPSPSGDPLGFGRTQVLGTSSINVPGLPVMASVMDAPWSAAGNAVRVTDGAITSGTNQLSSVSANFTAADQGKRVDVLGAAASGGTLFATISSVSGGVATLSANASTTVSGTTVTYGTEDTTAFNNAHTAISAKGGGTLIIPPGRAYLIAKVSPLSGVTVWAYGATLYPTHYTNNTGFANNSSTPVVGWSLLGATMIEDGVSSGTGYTGVYASVYIATTGGSPSTDIRVRDLTSINNKDSAVSLVAVQRAWVEDCYVNGQGHSGGRNAIAAWGAGTTDITYSSNVLVNCASLGLYFGGVGGSSSMTPSEVRATAIGNRVYGTITVGNGVNMEVGTAGFGKMVVANNTLNVPGTAISIGANPNNTADNVRWIVQGNYAEGGSAGGNSSAVVLDADDLTCTGNVVVLNSPVTGGSAIVTNKNSTTVTATLDGTTNVLTSVTIPSASQTQIPNGTPISGTGIPSGAYLVSGSGTATWTISQNTTSAATETVTCAVCAFRVSITSNTVYCTNTSTTAALSIQSVAYSQILDNIVYFDPGGTTSANAIWASGYNLAIRGNSLENAPGRSLRVSSTHDAEINYNRIHNGGQGGAAEGIFAQAGNCYNIDVIGNHIWDDNPAGSKLANGLNPAGGGFRACRNIIIGSTGTELAGSAATYIERSDNRFSTGPASGRATLVAGTVTVNTAEIRAGDNVQLTRNVAGGTVGVIQLGTIVAGTSFVINSVQPGTSSTLQSSDTSTVYWRIDH